MASPGNWVDIGECKSSGLSRIGVMDAFPFSLPGGREGRVAVVQSVWANGTSKRIMARVYAAPPEKDALVWIDAKRCRLAAMSRVDGKGWQRTPQVHVRIEKSTAAFEWVKGLVAARAKATWAA